jgi:predicted AlkP superfamily phosphohydrolase/phosphomutase
MFIGLDAASRDLVLEWSEQGLLPTLRSLQKTGAWGMTINAPAVYTGSLWPSVWTGTSPGRHGCYYNEQLTPGAYKVTDFLGKDVKQEPFWGVLSRAGHRIGLFDVPKTPLCEGLNGIQIVDWGTHDADIPACSWPPPVIDEIHEKYGASPFRRCDWVMDAPNPEETLRRHLLSRVEAKVAIAEDLLQREPWDLFMMGFGESHCVGHQCWHVHDPSHPKHDPDLLKRLGDPVRDVYIALDRAVGRILEYAGPETTVVLQCTHGMSAHYDATYLLDGVLRRLEGRPTPPVRAFLNRARRLWKKLPLRFTERFGTIARGVNRMPDADDRSARRCFVVPTNANSAGVRLNLVGREPNGKIQPGQEAEEFIARLTADLMRITEPTDGRRLVKEVVRSRDAFPGEHADLLPDLFIRWNRDAPITGVSSPEIGTLIEEDHHTRRTGDHRPGGLVFARGPNVRSGMLPPAKDEDIAPTLAALLGVNLPNVDGHSFLS